MIRSSASAAARLRLAQALAAAVALCPLSALADSLIDAGGRNPIPVKDAKVTGVDKAQLNFTAAGRARQLKLASVRNIEVANKEMADFNEAEKLYADESKIADAAKKYEAALNTGGPAYKPTLVRARLVAIYSKTGDVEKLAKHFVGLYEAAPADARLYINIDEVNDSAPDPAKDAAGKLLLTAANKNSSKPDFKVLQDLRAKIGGPEFNKAAAALEKSQPVAKAGSTGTGTSPTTPSTGGTTTPNPGGNPNPGGAAVVTGTVSDDFPDAKPASKGDIDEIAGAFKGGRAESAVEKYLKSELPTDASAEDAEKFHLSGGLALVKVAEKMGKEVEDLRAAMLREPPAKQDEFKKKLEVAEKQRQKILTHAGMALTEALQLPGSEDKRFAEAAYYAAWCHEQFNRPLRARAMYKFFIDTYGAGAPAEMVNKAKAAYDRLSEGS
jgi:hypothetical protein